jgi:hypothetical protein
MRCCGRQTVGVFMRFLKGLTAAVLGAVMAVASVSSASAAWLGLDEIRGGPTVSNLELIPGTWVVPQLSSFDFSNLSSAQFDFYWKTPLPNILRWAGSPRPFIGGIIGFNGRESTLHWGWQWHGEIGRIFYLEGAVGLGVHNGALSGAVPPNRNLGCRMLFHWSAGVGANITERLTLTAELQHMSNVIFNCVPNDGLNHVGVTLGWKF